MIHVDLVGGRRPSRTIMNNRFDAPAENVAASSEITSPTSIPERTAPAFCARRSKAGYDRNEGSGCQPCRLRERLPIDVGPRQQRIFDGNRHLLVDWLDLSRFGATQPTSNDLAIM
jgi:hypothetical protein